MDQHKLDMDTNCNLNQTMLRLGFKILRPEKPNIAPKWPTTPTGASNGVEDARKRPQLQSQQKHASVGIEIFYQKDANRPQNASQKHRIAPKSTNNKAQQTVQ